MAARIDENIMVPLHMANHTMLKNRISAAEFAAVMREVRGSELAGLWKMR